MWNTRCEQKLTGMLDANEKPHLNVPAFSAAAILRVPLWWLRDLSKSVKLVIIQLRFYFSGSGQRCSESAKRFRSWLKMAMCRCSQKSPSQSECCVRRYLRGLIHRRTANKWFKNMAIVLLLSLIAVGLRMCRSWHWSVIKNFDRVRGLFRWRSVRLDFQGVI